MDLDSNLRAFLDEFNTRPPLSADVSPYELRGDFDVRKKPLIPADSVRDYLVPVSGGQIVCRMYMPESEGPHPVCLFFHGGGFVSGSVDAYNHIMHGLCVETDCIIVSVGYRLAPENKFPTCFEDCYMATKWVAGNAAFFDGDASKLALIGDGSGATLAAAISLMARDAGGPAICLQVLLGGVMDMAHSVPTKSREEFGAGYYLTLASAAVFSRFLCRSSEDERNVWLSGVMTPNLANLPKTFVLANEWDMLRDENEIYAQRLAAAGNEVEYYMAPGVIHNSLMWSTWSEACKERVYDVLVAKLNETFSTSVSIENKYAPSDSAALCAKQTS
ncbi:MAG: alpha/beta hydrolase [Eggerthellaceae bacterium]|nr:alpha/beta hydrolase [Eggerthellaceae bacterium]